MLLLIFIVHIQLYLRVDHDNKYIILFLINNNIILNNYHYFLILNIYTIIQRVL